MGGFAGCAVEGDGALSSEGYDESADCGVVHELPCDGVEAAAEVGHAFADFAFGGGDEVEVAEARERALSAGDVAGDHGDFFPDFGEDFFDGGGGEQAVAEVAEDDEVGGVAGVHGLAVEGFDAGGVEGGYGAFVDFEDFCGFAEVAVFGDELAAVGECAGFDAGGGEAVTDGGGFGVVAEMGDEGGGCAHGGCVASDDGGTAVVVSAGEEAECHHGAFGGD